MSKLFKKILVANRSEIAVRVMRACRSLGIPTVAVYSETDVNSKHRLLADESVLIGPPSPRESYLNIEKIIKAAKETGCDAIHPGYGFLAENPLFPKACAEAGIVFIGPGAEAMRLLGNKVESRIKMADSGVPLTPGMKGSGKDIGQFAKAAAGGGGKGMRIVHEQSGLREAIDAAQREALNAFGDDTIYLEKYLTDPRHIEFQVLADQHGHCIHLFERECSIQRRHQKIIEETPSIALSDELRTRMGADAVKVAQAAGYTNAGTVEFLLDKSGKYYFLEMNTRIQVEHPITEMVVGVDLVVEQIKVAAGLPLGDHLKKLNQRGHAIECRIYAEDGENNFLPSIGTILHYSEPEGPGVRVDSGIALGSDISMHYDPIMAKLIVHAPDRNTAIFKMTDALEQFKILGVKTSRRFMIEVLNHPEFVAGQTFTSFIPTHMATREISTHNSHALAAAIASAVLSRPSASADSVGVRRSIATPWDSIGSWQIGDLIHE